MKNKSPQPLVSVTIPCHDKGDTITRAIKSIQAQTLNNIECFIVLDRCSDNSEDEVKKAIKGDKRFSYHIVDNGNVADTRNYGATLAKGLFLSFLDGDDWLDERFLEICIPPLLEDRSLGATYTGLWFHKPDGSEGLSPWPGEWDYDKALKGQNQCPTCSVIRKEAWDRLGGQRRRYCGKGGAGAEDGEFYLRLGAYGWKAQKVTDAGLFHYSWMTGIVTGDKNYSEPDYKAWHAWTRDNKHPFASYASANRFSHAVRQYDTPQISVIIPVGVNHTGSLIDALDSLEAQSFRNWEVIVVWDFELFDYTHIEKVYPYVNYLSTTGQGAGVARNKGVDVAKAPLILYLDADDTLHPDCLQMMLTYYSANQSAIYTDYVGHAFIEPEYAKELGSRLKTYDPDTKEALIAYKSADFNYDKVKAQPQLEKPYIWNLVTTLFPKTWHYEIGGFDEEMETWEDWDYWLRMAKAGKCFVRLEQELVRYRFYTGERREIGRQIHGKMIDYLQKKHKDIELMGCGCRKNGVVRTPSIRQQIDVAGGNMADSDFVRAIYQGSMGAHHVIGGTRFPQSIEGIQMRQISPHEHAIVYGRIQGGDIRLVHQADIQSMPGKWQVVPEAEPALPVEAAPPPPPPVEIAEETPVMEIIEAATTDISPKKININIASVTELMRLPRIGQSVAIRIVEARPFNRLTDLKQVKGISDKLYKLIKGKITI